MTLKNAVQRRALAQMQSDQMDTVGEHGDVSIAPFCTFVDPAFWQLLYNRKLHEWKLDTDPVPLFVTYDNSEKIANDRDHRHLQPSSRARPFARQQANSSANVAVRRRRSTAFTARCT